MLEDVTFNLSDTTKTLQLKGEVPEGTITITKEGKVAIAVHNNRYCVTKGIEDKDVTITENYESCNLPSVEEEPEENTPQTGSIKTLVTTSTTVTSVPACINDGTTCALGTPVAIKVNESEVHNFYVISETENEVTLIMDRNIYAQGSKADVNVAWINSNDYVLANSEEGDNTSCSYTSCNDEGPITAVAELKERTSSWSNIAERTYTYSDDGGGNKYTAFTETMRARMLTRTEVINIKTANNNTTPSWMYINLYDAGDNNTKGYWLSAAFPSDSTHAWNVDYSGSIFNASVYSAANSGVRPVITLSK